MDNMHVIAILGKFQLPTSEMGPRKSPSQLSSPTIAVSNYGVIRKWYGTALKMDNFRSKHSSLKLILENMLK